MKAGFIYKRALVVLLCIVMLASCWVFTATPQASAATAGNYYVKVTYQVDNTHSSTTNYIKVNYKKQDGSTSSYNIGGSCASSSGGKEDKRSCAGLPYSIEYHNYGSSTDHSDWFITGVYVYSGSDYSTGGTTLWTGKFGCTNAHYNGSTISCTYSIVDNSFGTWSGDGSATKTTNSRNWKGYPAATSASSFSVTNKTIPDSSTNVTTTVSIGTVKDQYGVNWKDDGDGVSFASTTGVSASGKTITITKDAMVSGSPYYKDITLTAKCGSTNLSNTCTLRITNPSYTVTWHWHVNGNNSSTWGGSTTSTGIYYNQTPSVPSGATSVTKY
ncbi:MAG: hypothetical protein IJI67_03310, partial [Clostridia bacterium]|nr:hypothetical protein [Clostridia bacterium]